MNSITLERDLMAIEPRESANLNQTIGSLNAKADQSQRDVSEVRSDMRSIENKIDNIPSIVEEIVRRHMKPIEARLEKVESTVTDVQETVQRWKTIVGFVLAFGGLLGAIVAWFVSVKKNIGW